MWRELDALNVLVVEHLLGPVAAAVVRCLSCRSSASLRELERSLRKQLRTSARCSNAHLLSHSKLRTSLRVALVKLLERGVVQYSYSRLDQAPASCQYTLSRRGALWLYGFPFLQRYITELHCMHWRKDQDLVLHSNDAGETILPSPRADHHETQLETSTIVNLCNYLTPFRKVPMDWLLTATPDSDNQSKLIRSTLQRLVGIGLLEQCTARRVLAELLSLELDDEHPEAREHSKPGDTMDQEACTLSEIDSTRQVPAPALLANRSAANDEKPSPQSADHEPQTRLRARRRLRLRKLDTGADDEAVDQPYAATPQPSVSNREMQAAPAPAPETADSSQKGESTMLALGTYLRVNERFIRDAIRDIHMAAWAAEQLHSCDDSHAGDAATSMPLRLMVQRTAVLLNAMLYLRRVVQHGSLVHVLPARCSDPSLTSLAGAQKGFSLDQILYVIRYRYRFPSDQCMETVSALDAERILEELADDRVGFLTIHERHGTKLYAPAYAYILDQYRTHVLEGMLLAMGDLYLHRVWRMVLEYGPLSTRSCEEHALLPARAVRAYLFYLFQDGWISLGDHLTSAVTAVPISLPREPFPGSWRNGAQSSAADHEPDLELRQKTERAIGPGFASSRSGIDVTPSALDSGSPDPTSTLCLSPDGAYAPDLEDSYRNSMTQSDTPTGASWLDLEGGWHVDLDAIQRNVVRVCLLAMQNVFQQIQVRHTRLAEHNAVLRATNKSGIDPRVYDEHVRGARHVGRQLRHLRETYYRLAEALMTFWDEF
jgi:hypothetical protein